MKSALLALLFPLTAAFVASPTAKHALLLKSSPSDKEVIVSEKVAIDFDSDRQQREELKSIQANIDAIKLSVKSAQNDTAINELEKSLSDIEIKVSELTSTALPPPGLSVEEYTKACLYFAKLPMRIRWALCLSLDMGDDGLDDATNWDKIPEIVSKLYRQRRTLTPAALESALEKALASQAVKKPKIMSDNEVEVDVSRLSELFQESSSSDTAMASQKVNNLLGVEESVDDMHKRRAESILPRVTRDGDRTVSQKQLDELLEVLRKDCFVVAGKEEIPGGYVLRGTNRCKTGTELVEKMDSLLPQNWPAQACYVEEFTNLDGTDEPVIVLLQKDLSPLSNDIVKGLSSISALVTVLLFSLGVYGGNSAVTSRISEPGFVDDLSGLSWFNGKVVEVLAPMLFIQASTEISQYIIAQKDGTKTTFPTLLPCWGLPFLGSLKSMKESPKNLAALFDYGFVGPSTGIALSLGFLVAGLQLTNMAGPEMTQYYPMLPVNVIKISALGGYIVDFFAGGEGFVTTQDPLTGIPMHPLSIAGFTGLVINALELLPLGATNGGRLSLAVFGRKGHTLMGGLTWCFLLYSAFFMERADALIGAWTVYSVTQNDAEIPCRDEVTTIDPARAVLAFGLWFVAVLAFVPL